MSESQNVQTTGRLAKQPPANLDEAKRAIYNFMVQTIFRDCPDTEDQGRSKDAKYWVELKARIVERITLRFTQHQVPMPEYDIVKTVDQLVNDYIQRITPTLYTGSFTMKLNLSFVLPLIEAGVLKALPTVEGETAAYPATVIDVKGDTVHLQLNDDITAKVKFEGDSEVTQGAVIQFHADGNLKHVTLPVVPEKPAQKSSTRSPDRDPCTIGVPATRSARQNC